MLGSRDERVGVYAAQLFLQGYGGWLIISGGNAHANDLLYTGWSESEAAHFAKLAVDKGVPSSKIIIEDQAANTGENIMFTYNLLAKKHQQPTSFLLVQKPYMERRTFATFKKQWPRSNAEIIVTSPPIPYEEYFDDQNKKEHVLNIMVGDLQRICEYSKRGFQIEQLIPQQVWQAFEVLVARGYNQHLIR